MNNEEVTSFRSFLCSHRTSANKIPILLNYAHWSAPKSFLDDRSSFSECFKKTALKSELKRRSYACLKFPAFNSISAVLPMTPRSRTSTPLTHAHAWPLTHAWPPSTAFQPGFHCIRASTPAQHTLPTSNVDNFCIRTRIYAFLDALERFRKALSFYVGFKS